MWWIHLEAKNLGEYATQRSSLLRDQGWITMVKALWADTNIHPAIHHIQHPAAHLLDHLQLHGVPVHMHSGMWMLQQLNAAMAHRSHYSARQNLEFLSAEMMTMLQKGQWLILPYANTRNLENLWLSPLGMVPQ